jgi:putative transposase
MTSDVVSSWTKIKKVGSGLSPEQATAVVVARARERGLVLTGPDGLLKLVTKSVLETALNEERTEHSGDAVGEVEIAVPRDRQGTFSPAIVKKRQRRLGGCR